MKLSEEKTNRCIGTRSVKMANLICKELKNLNCNPKSRVGEVRKSNFNGLMKIIEYKNWQMN